MDVERSDRIELDAHEDRCAHTQWCQMYVTCARALAVIPRGAGLSDYTITGECGAPYYRLYVQARKRDRKPLEAPRGIKLWPGDE